MKKVAFLLAVAALGYLAYTRLAAPARSPEEGEYRRISKTFDSALSRYGQANRAIGVGGLDMTSDIEDIASSVDALRKDLASLGERVEGEALRTRIGELAARMDAFLSDKR
jgi:hypothetical protein